MTGSISAIRRRTFQHVPQALVGVQIIGRQFGEATALEIAKVLVPALGGYKMMEKKSADGKFVTGWYLNDLMQFRSRSEGTF